MALGTQMQDIEPIPPQRLNPAAVGMGDLGVKSRDILPAVLTPMVRDGAEAFTQERIELANLALGHGI